MYILLLLAACGNTSLLDCDAVELEFAGMAVTVADTPLGLDDSVRTESVIGALSYHPCMPDERPDDTERGEFDQPEGGEFELDIVDVTVKGSGWPVLTVEDLPSSNTWRFEDGSKVTNEGDRFMTVDGDEKPDLGLSIAITDSTAEAFSDDQLPEAFPMTDIVGLPHTFSLDDDGGTLLIQLDTLEQVAP